MKSKGQINIANALGFSFSRLTRSSRFLLPYFLSFCIIALITVIGLILRGWITPTNLVMPYLLGVVSIAYFWGSGPAVFASVLGVVAFDIFLVPPYLTLVVEDTEYVITFFSLFLVGTLISSLTARIKDQMIAAREREARVTSLYHLSQELAVAFSFQDVLKAILDSISHTFKQDVWLFLADLEAGLSDIPHNLFTTLNAEKRDVDSCVIYAFKQGVITGFSTDFDCQSDTINLPLTTNSGIVGVLSVSAKGLQGNIQFDQIQFYEAFANLSALAIERIFLDKQASQTQILKAKEELQSALLSSVSHDFRTPLVTIIGTLSSLNSEIDLLDKYSQHNLIRSALSEAEKLNLLVSNLLNMSRLEAGALNLQLEPVDVQDLIGVTLEKMKNRMDRQINIHVPEKIPLILADFVLVEQALINVLENAIKYSPEESPVDIYVRIDSGWVYLDISDRGFGIDPGEVPKIFDKFYQIKNKERPSGTGLGLAIAKGIVDAHQAQIIVTPREGGGTTFRIGFAQLEFQSES